MEGNAAENGTIGATFNHVDGTIENGCDDHQDAQSSEENIRKNISETHVLKAASKKLGTDHFLLLTFEEKPSDDGSGLLDNHSILNIAYLNDLGTKEYLKFFVKRFSELQSAKLLCEGIEAFEKEIFVHEIFQDFVDNDVCLIRNIVPQCFVSVDAKYLIMDDISTDSYTSVNEHIILDYESVLVVLQTIAQLHASSIIFEHKMKRTLLESYPTGFNESFFIRKSAKVIDTLIEFIIEQIELSDLPKNLKSGKKFSDSVKEVCYKIYDSVKPSSRFKNVLTHGNMITKNILFKRDAKTGKPLSCKLVNFENGRYAPPAQDVLSFLFSATSRKFRDQYMYEVVGMYYSYLEKSLKYVGLDINNILPFSDFMESCEDQKSFAVVKTVIYFPIILLRADTEQSKDENFNGETLGDNSIRLALTHEDNGDFYRERLRESIENLKDLCELYTS